MDARRYLMQALEDFQCTQEALAVMLGIPKSTFKKWLHRNNNVPHQRLLVLALAAIYHMRRNFMRADELMQAHIIEPEKVIAVINQKRKFTPEEEQELYQKAISNYGEQQ